jgi:3-oxoacyl-[acyl-carrier-protein] synthase II
MKPEGTKRIAVTGVGVVSAIGLDRHEFWDALTRGASGISDVQRFATAAFGRSRGAEIRGFDVTRVFPGEPRLERLGRAKQMMLAATKECLGSAGAGVVDDPFRVGVAIGTTMGESQSLEAVTDAIGAGLEIPTDAVLDYPPSTIPQAVAERFRLYGPNYMVPNACAAGNFSIGQAVACIQAGEADAMVAGGADAFSRYAYSGFCRVGAIAPDVPRPFSKDRKGMVPGEGAAALLVEDWDRAVARGATIYAEIVGYGESCDAHHITQPHDAGVAQAIRRALEDARLEPRQISFVSVHGTGTPTNDATETRALRSVFGEHLPSVPVSAVKSMTGHPMGAASAIECVAAILSMHHQFLPPTVNFEEPDPECDVDCVPNRGRPFPVSYVLKTSSAFGGNNSSIVFKTAERRA